MNFPDKYSIICVDDGMGHMFPAQGVLQRIFPKSLNPGGFVSFRISHIHDLES